MARLALPPRRLQQLRRHAVHLRLEATPLPPLLASPLPLPTATPPPELNPRQSSGSGGTGPQGQLPPLGDFILINVVRNPGSTLRRHGRCPRVRPTSHKARQTTEPAEIGGKPQRLPLL
eukprot:RCo034404